MLFGLSARRSVRGASRRASAANHGGRQEGRRPTKTRPCHGYPRFRAQCRRPDRTPRWRRAFTPGVGAAAAVSAGPALLLFRSRSPLKLVPTYVPLLALRSISTI